MILPGALSYVEMKDFEGQSYVSAEDYRKLENQLYQLVGIIETVDNDTCMCGEDMRGHVAFGGCGSPTGMFDWHYSKWKESISRGK